jgi:hypothetical protein
LVGQKAPLRVSEIWAIRVCLEISSRAWDLALFNLAIDSKSTVRYLGIEVDDALEMAEQMDA